MHNWFLRLGERQKWTGLDATKPLMVARQATKAPVSCLPFKLPQVQCCCQEVESPEDWDATVGSRVRFSIMGLSSHAPWSLLEHNVRLRTIYVDFIQTAEPAESLSLQQHAVLAPWFSHRADCGHAQFTCVCTCQEGDRFQNTCSEPQDTAVLRVSSSCFLPLRRRRPI